MRPLPAHSTTFLLSTITVLVTAAALLIAADRFTRDEAAGHARYNLTFGLLAALLAIAPMAMGDMYSELHLPEATPRPVAGA
jgi:hypothetical protein